jgi:[amino group carrier protein]-lysine/ornithine hydrolase
MNEVDLLEGLLKCYSPTLHEEEAVTYLVGQMSQAGYSAQIDPAGNAVGTRGEGPNELILLGHIDTVPGFIEVRRDGDLLYGRGAVDAKGPLACFTTASALVDLPSNWRLTVIGAVGEEGPSRGAHYIKDLYHPQALIIGEPSRWNRVTLGYKGSVWFSYTVKLAQGHTAGKNASACEAAVDFWIHVQSWADNANQGQTAAFEQLTPTLRGMDSETDGFYQTAHLKIGVRLPPGIQPEEVRFKLEEMQGEGALTMEDGIPAYRAEKNNALVRAFLQSIRAEGGSPSFALKTGTSDMNIVAPIWNCPTLAYGPGDSTLDHTPNEHISIEEYRQGVRVLAGAIQRLCSES